MFFCSFRRFFYFVFASVLCFFGLRFFFIFGLVARRAHAGERVRLVMSYCQLLLLLACSALRQVSLTMAPSDPALCSSLHLLVTDLLVLLESCSISRSSIFLLGFPLGRFPFIFFYSTVFRKQSCLCLKICPI